MFNAPERDKAGGAGVKRKALEFKMSCRTTFRQIAFSCTARREPPPKGIQNLSGMD